MTSALAGRDLLSWSLVRRLVRSSAFPYALQVPLLVVFIGLLAAGWGVHAPGGAPSKVFAKANVVTLAIWGLWWPAMVAAALTLGRVWCAVCPLELVSHVSERAARGLGLQRRPLPRWMTAGGVILVLYAVMQLLVARVQMHRVPAYTSWLLLALLALAVAVPFFYRDRALCRAFCPAGLLLSVYGRGGGIAVRRRDADVCAGCAGKNCASARQRDAWSARSCPSLLNPARLNDSRDCLLCAQCLQACPHDNLQLLARTPFAAADRRVAAASWPLTLTVMLLSVFVTSELMAESRALTAVPGLVFAPLAVWAGMAMVGAASERRLDVVRHWCEAAWAAALVIGAAHAVKGLAKVTAWAAFLPLVSRDPGGMSTVAALRSGALAEPERLLPLAGCALAGIAFVSVALVFAVRESYRAHDGVRPASVFGIGLLAVLFGGMLLAW